MAKAKEQFLDKGLLEIFQYIFFFRKNCLGVLPTFMLPEKIGQKNFVFKIKRQKILELYMKSIALIRLLKNLIKTY